MRRWLGKLAPVLVGLGIGYLIWYRPEALAGHGVLAALVGLGLAALALLVFVGITIASNLPANAALDPRDDGALTDDVRLLVEQYLALGFVRVGPALEVRIAPPALLVGLVHEEARTYGSVFRTGTLPAKTSFDFVSILEGDLGGLTTNAEVMGAMLPAAPGALRQVFPGASPAQVFGHHRDGLAYLERRGLRARPVAASLFAEDLRAGIARQRRAFLSSPVRCVLVTLGRNIARTTPHVGPLVRQRVGEEEIERLLRER